MMTRRISNIIAAALLLCSCVHEFPEATTPAQVDITLTFNTDMPYYMTRKFPEETSTLPSKSTPENDAMFAPDYSGHDKYDIRYIVEAYRKIGNGAYSTQPARRWVFTDEDATVMDDYSFSVTLDEGKYIFRAWADFVNEGSADMLYYDASNWSYGIWFDHLKYVGNSDTRDAFVGNTEVQVIRYGSEIEPVSGVIEMKRPHGKYVFITNDLAEFIDRNMKGQQFDINDYTIVVEYLPFLPQRYSIINDRSVWSVETARYESKLTRIDDNRALMGFDYILTGTNDDTFVTCQLKIKDRQGNNLAEHANIKIPLNANMYTIIEGRFMMQESSGGVAIDPGFNGPDIVVPVN